MNNSQHSSCSVYIDEFEHMKHMKHTCVLFHRVHVVYTSPASTHPVVL